MMIGMTKLVYYLRLVPRDVSPPCSLLVPVIDFDASEREELRQTTMTHTRLHRFEVIIASNYE
jgi:hypothetical protein